ncbi:MAG TPA: GAF domain-containing sensor histidine kinase [Candidatus Solibacter sp.]|jgi:signal transduction histidine kinase|nr:GAF domain-containing sensor histidine kinase [Candidatus Solibacter sp.]
MTNMRKTSWLAWSTAAAVIVLFVTGIGLGLARGTVHVTGMTTLTWVDVVTQVPFLGFPVVGALIISRQPRNPVGWLLTAVGVSATAGNFVTEYSIAALVLHRDLPAGQLAAWLSYWVWAPAGALAPLVILLFPDGRFLTRRWRWVGVAGGANLVGIVAVQMFATYSFAPVRNPLAIPAVTSLGDSIGPTFGAGTALLSVVALVSFVLRYRRATSEVRQQIKWVAYSMALLPPFLVVSALTSPQGAPDNALVILSGVLNFVATLSTPVCLGIAMLRFRLYDIDVVISRTLVYGSLAAFITAVYVGIVVGVGTLVGSGGQPNLVLSIVATAIVAVAFQPVRERLQKIANRLVYGKRATPYEVLSQFSERVSETYAADEALPRMAKVLAEGTGAERAEVWLRADDLLRRAAAWPQDSAPAEPGRVLDETLPSMPGADRAVPVRHQGELLGALTVTKRAGESLTPVEEKLLDDLAAQAGLVLKNVGLTAELLARLEELRASRQRLVAAQDEERRRLERNLHDGAQQNLVALKVKLGLAETFAEKDPAKAKELVAQLKTEADEALETLRDLARGIYPPLLADKGLAVALESQARKATLPVDVESDGIGRYPQDIEAAVYFCCLEALQNVQKYAEANRAVVRLRETTGDLCFEVRDDGRGFDPATAKHGAGMTNMADRLDALGGSLHVAREGLSTIVGGRLPIPVPEVAGT